MATEADKLAIKLESYVLQLREVEAALNVDPTHVELIKIKADLNELIHLTKKILTEKLNAGVTITGHNGGGSCGEPGPSRSSSSRSQSAAKTEVIIIRIPSACSCGSNSTVSKIEDTQSRNEITTSLKDEQKVEDGPSILFSTTSNVDEFTNSAHNSGVEVPSTSTSTIVPHTSTHILQTRGSNESANYTESAIPLPNVSMANADHSASNLTGGGIKTVNLSVDAEANSIESAATTPATNPYDKIVKENEIANDDLVKNWNVIRKANLSKNMINRLRVKRRRLRQNELKKTLSLFGMEDYWKNLKPPKRKRKKNFKR
ncbi:unnamed protein product [Orchesella dallaii]|uniref:Uncharacterized protein n=1 Tax=Orchesella dallaii TaxID=48710 RepID=A0ABP1QT22_9HEXA